MQAILEAIDASRHGDGGLPNGVYTSAEFLRWEHRNLFAPRWFGVAFGNDVPNPGDIRKVDLLGMSIIVLRDENRGVRVFHNVCRHRGRQLVDESCSHARMIRCPYHAWTYRLDGRLNGTPHIGGAGIHTIEGFDKADHGLLEIRSRMWMDIVFINLNDQAGSFDEFMAPLATRLGGLWGAEGGDLMTPADDGSMEMEVRSNWKLALENYLEAYHLPIVHPGLNSYSPLSNHYLYHDAMDFAGQGVTTYRPNITAGQAMPSLPHWPHDRHHTAEYPALYPNVLVGVQHDHFFAMLLIPLACDHTLERVELQYVTEAARDAALINTRHAIMEGWRLVFQEDVAAVEGMQRGRASDAFDGGVFTPVLDRATRHFHRWFAEQVADMGRASACS